MLFLSSLEDEKKCFFFKLAIAKLWRYIIDMFDSNIFSDIFLHFSDNIHAEEKTE